MMDEIIRNSVKILTREHYDTQSMRLKLEGRIGITKSGAVKKGAPEVSKEVLAPVFDNYEFWKQREADTEKALKKEVKKHILWKAFLKDVKGCGEAMAAVIISEIDIERAKTVSSIWSFAGMAPGKDRKVKGQTRAYNQFLKDKMLGILGSSFLKCKSPYSEYYYSMRHRFESQNWGMDSKVPSDKTKPKAMHQHKAANRYMVKMFLKDLYVAWRTIEGLPVREPYQEEYLNHRHVG